MRSAIAAPALASGAGVGIARFLGTENPVWIGVGTGIGMAIGAAIDSRRRAGRHDPEKRSPGTG